MAIKAADLTKQLLLISCKHPIIPTPVNLNIYINELLESMNVLGGHHVNIITHLEKELWKVKADVANTRQILINLLKNACEAMPDGGTLSLKTRNVFFTEEQVISHAGARPGKFVCFFVADTGCGIQEHMIYEIFEPLFTTKEKASGLGLTVVSGVVSHYKGWISVNTLEGKGTEFEIYLPVYEN
jgi:two-component system cell cycle sensor histidine kinase/response regulator CckA